MSFEARVFNVFKDVLELGPEVDPKSLRYNEITTWDFLRHITLVSALEGEFDIMLDPDEILAMSSYGKAVEIVGKYAYVG